jgi:hypothetical protein
MKSANLEVGSKKKYPESLIFLQVDFIDKTELLVFFSMVLQPIVGQGLLITEASRSHSDTTHSVGFLCTSDQPDAETST